MVTMSNQDLKKLKGNDKLTLEDVRKLYERMKKQEELEYNFPTKPSSDGYYHLYIKDETRKSGRRQIKAKTLDELVDKAYSIEKSSDLSILTFGSVFEQAQEQKLKFVKNPEKRISVENSIGRNRSEYRRFFKGTDFEKRLVSDITQDDIEQITYDSLTRYDLTQKGFLSFRSILRQTLVYAEDHQYIKDNPYSHISFAKYKDMIIPDVPIEKRAHTDEEVANIIDYLHRRQKKQPWHIGLWALECQIIMGLRRGEVPPLRWSDVSDAYISICREQLTSQKAGNKVKAYDLIVDHTKTYSNRNFPITTELGNFLSRLKDNMESIGIRSEYLFPLRSDPSKCLRNGTMYDCYIAACKDLNIKRIPGVTKGTHSFRRNAITRVINKTGGNVVLATKIFGNSPLTAMKHYYTGVDLAKAKEALE